MKKRDLFTCNFQGPLTGKSYVTMGLLSDT